MIVSYDKLNKARKSPLILCNPNGEELYSLGLAKDINFSIRLNGLSELSFVVNKYNDDKIIPYYDFLITRRCIEMKNVGRFIITSVQTEMEGTSEYKIIQCKGLEYELASKNLGLLEGTYKFYDPSSSDKSLMHIVLSYLPNWKIGEIEDDLWNIYRTFDIKDNNIYNFLMGEVQETYRCIFIIDTFKRTISAKTVESIITKTDVFLSSRNILKQMNIEENAEDIKTALNIYGDGDLSIHSVNPMQTATIYDFSYYKNVPDMMSDNLISAINKWEAKLDGYKKEYSDILLSIKDSNGFNIKKQEELKKLEAELNSLLDQQSIKITAGEDLTDINNKIEAKKKEIENKKKEIENQNNSIEDKKKRTSQIADDLKFKNNFSPEQLKELDTYIIQSSYQNTNFSVTDEMTEVQKQEVVENLYNYGLEQLNNISKPTYRFDVDVLDFIKMKKYKSIVEQLTLGSEITILIDRKKNIYARAILLGYDSVLDNQDSLTLHFSNKLKFKEEKYIWVTKLLQ